MIAILLRIFRVILWISCYLKPMLHWSTCLSWLTVCDRRQKATYCLTLSEFVKLTAIQYLSHFWRFHAVACTCLSMFEYTYAYTVWRTQKANNSWQYSSNCPFRSESLATPTLETYLGKKRPVHYIHHIYTYMYIYIYIYASHDEQVAYMRINFAGVSSNTYWQAK